MLTKVFPSHLNDGKQAEVYRRLFADTIVEFVELDHELLVEL
ncbi:hypothetical protein SAMN05421504_102129 [Amycolatopsis xylanica]|uniref:Uncharacterized protein n=1 Tax=Amycolatopsis xylanica TaxID=589385 RepID=A0A1H2YIB8_9PSEU|nr:hypothetical protein [Amycolatopsis xylanica]SDX04289.1 hypothetical protein SAMN05421504_102129 [Amycolatopsis xylanica]